MKSRKDETKVHQRYYLKNGKQVPGVTTVLNVLAKPALINWAWKLGLEGQDMHAVKNMAADIGVVTHEICECALRGTDPNMDIYKPADVEVALPLYEWFFDWWCNAELEAVGIEVSVVSERWEFGGTLDLVARHPKRGLGLLDYKTSSGVYESHYYQLSAYEVLWNENHPNDLIKWVEVIHLDKYTGYGKVHPIGVNLAVPYFEVFKHARAIYVLQKSVKSKLSAPHKPRTRKDIVKRSTLAKLAKGGLNVR